MVSVGDFLHHYIPDNNSHRSNADILRGEISHVISDEKLVGLNREIPLSNIPDDVPDGLNGESFSEKISYESSWGSNGDLLLRKGTSNIPDETSVCINGEFSRGKFSGDVPGDNGEFSHGDFSRDVPGDNGEFSRGEFSGEVPGDMRCDTTGDITCCIPGVLPCVTTAPFTHGGNGDILKHCRAGNVENELMCEDNEELFDNDESGSSEEEFTDCSLGATKTSSNKTIELSVCDDVCWNCRRIVQTGIFDANCYNMELSNHLCDDLKTSKKYLA